MGRRSVLCIDPDGFGLQVRRLVLESRGYQVFAFTSTSEAVQFLQKHRVEVVMLDESLEVDHPGTAKLLKSVESTLPILMLSNHPYPPEGVGPYVDSFITRGESPHKLLASLDLLVARASGPHARLRPFLWAGGAVFTSAAWLAARALRKTHHEGESEEPTKKQPTSALPHIHRSKSGRA